MKERIEIKMAWTKLAPVAAWIKAKRGRLQDMATAVSKKAKRTIQPHNMAFWFHEDPTRRHAMSFGMGLLILSVWEKLKAKEKHEG